MKLLVAIYYYFAFFSYVAILLHNLLLKLSGDLTIAIGGAGLITTYIFGSFYIKLFTGMSFFKAFNESRYFIIGYLILLMIFFIFPMMVTVFPRQDPDPAELGHFLLGAYMMLGIGLHIVLAVAIYKYYGDIYQIQHAIYDE